MKFDRLTTAVAFVVLFAILAAGTFMSPMQTSTVAMALGGILGYGIVVLALGIKHGEYRASR